MCFFFHGVRNEFFFFFYVGSMSDAIQLTMTEVTQKEYMDVREESQPSSQTESVSQEVHTQVQIFPLRNFNFNWMSTLTEKEKVKERKKKRKKEERKGRSLHYQLIMTSETDSI